MEQDGQAPYEPPVVTDLGTLTELTRTKTVGSKNETGLPGNDKS